MEDKKLEERKKKFMDPVKDGRAQRGEFMVGLRKKRKQEIFKKKRMLKMDNVASGASPDDPRLATNGATDFTNARNDIPSVKYKTYLTNIVPKVYDQVPVVSRFL